MNVHPKLARLLAENFKETDTICILSYRFNPNSDVEASRDLRKFLSRLKRYKENNGISTKNPNCYTEYSFSARSERYIHYLIMDGMIDRKIVTTIWGQGYVSIKPVISDKTIEGMMKYLSKE